MAWIDKEPQSTKIETHHSAPPLDESLYGLRPQDAVFFKKLTGIEDDAVLKQHILDIQAKAYKVAPYGCIYLFVFTRHRLSALPAYQQVLRLGHECKNPIFLDIGCCFGNDIREAVLDGFPAVRAIGCDLRPELWNLGHELFKSSPDTFPAHFVGGDAFDPEILSIAPPASMQTAGALTPDLSNLTSLNPLRGCVSAIHATAFFHLFKEDQQLHMARAFAGLLSAEPGSVILGAHTGTQEKGVMNKVVRDLELDMFTHSAESWTAMWNGEVFEKGTVKVEAELRQTSVSVGSDEHYPILFWSVTRLQMISTFQALLGEKTVRPLTPDDHRVIRVCLDHSRAQNGTSPDVDCKSSIEAYFTLDNKDNDTQITIITLRAQNPWL